VVDRADTAEVLEVADNMDHWVRRPYAVEGARCA
jgi:hypothetical protein